MVIVLEGIRRSGKSTFSDACEKYGKENGIPTFCFYDRELQSYAVNQMEANFVSCMQFAKAAFEVNAKLTNQQLTKEPIILFDRFHLSELIFGYYLRGYRNDEAMGMVDRFLAKYGASLLLFESATSEERLKEPQELYREDFKRMYEKSEIQKKATVCLDEAKGEISADLWESILRGVK